MTTGRSPAGAGYRERNSTADRALEILMMFSDERLAVSAAEVATQLQVARSTAYRYLQSLVQTGFVEESGTGFRLGRRVLELARLARRGLGLSEIARPVMRRLADDTGEAVLLTRLAGTSVICLEREGGAAHAVRISYERGEVLPTNAGASALALLAWLPEEQVEQILSSVHLRRFTPSTLVTPAEIRERLAQTRTAGYAVSHSELDFDVLGIAAPVWAVDGQVACAIGVAAVTARVSKQRVAATAQAVCAAAAEITESLALLG